MYICVYIYPNKKTKKRIQLYIYRANKIYLFNASMNYIMLDKTIYIIIKL